MKQLGLLEASSAEISHGGRYRWRLTRVWGQGARVCWIMLNPSTADASVDDPTIRRCRGFSQAWGFGGLHVVNLFPLRASEPRVLREVNASIRRGIGLGRSNREWIKECAADAGKVVCAWGAGLNPAR